MLRTIHLHGRLETEFGARHELDIDTPLEAVRALLVLHQGFEARLRQGAYRVVRGSADDGLELGDGDLTLAMGRCSDLHLVPVIEGAGGRGTAKIIIGIALVGMAVAFAPAVVGFAGPTMGMATPIIGTAGSFAITFNTIASLGVSMALAGVAQALAPTPKAADYGNREKPDQRASFLFNGPVNAQAEGAVIPLVYGRHLVGSVVVAAGLDVYDIDNAATANNGGL